MGRRRVEHPGRGELAALALGPRRDGVGLAAARAPAAVLIPGLGPVRRADLAHEPEGKGTRTSAARRANVAAVPVVPVVRGGRGRTPRTSGANVSGDVRARCSRDVRVPALRVVGHWQPGVARRAVRPAARPGPGGEPVPAGRAGQPHRAGPGPLRPARGAGRDVEPGPAAPAPGPASPHHGAGLLPAGRAGDLDPRAAASSRWHAAEGRRCPGPVMLACPPLAHAAADRAREWPGRRRARRRR